MQEAFAEAGAGDSCWFFWGWRTGGFLLQWAHRGFDYGSKADR